MNYFYLEIIFSLYYTNNYTMSRDNKTSKLNEQSYNSESDNDNDTNYDSETTSSLCDCENEKGEFDFHKYHKFLAKCHPSKFMKKKVKIERDLIDMENKLDILDKKLDQEKKFLNKQTKNKTNKPIKSDKNIKLQTTNKKQTTNKSQTTNKKQTNKKSNNNKSDKNITNKTINKSKKRKIIESSDEEDDDTTSNYESTEETSSQDSYDEEDDYEEKSTSSEQTNTSNDDDDDKHNLHKSKNTKIKPGKFNLIFTIGRRNKDISDFDKLCKNNTDDDYENSCDDESWETCSQTSTEEHEDDPISSDDDKEENPSKIVTRSVDKNKNKNKNISENNTENNNSKEKNTINQSINNNNTKQEQNLTENKLLQMLRELQDKDNKLVNDCINICEQKINMFHKKQELKLKKEKERNERIFKRMLREKNSLNDFEFYKKMSIDEQKKIIKELREINKVIQISKPYRLLLLETDISINFKAVALKKINALKYMEQGSGEFYKIKNWVDTFVKIPFNNYKTLPITISDGIDKCHDFMANAQQILDNAVYGLNDAKIQIMQLLGQLITNPTAVGTAIAIHGPAGTGKTTLVKEGISKILNRPFAFIALGGATDSSFLEGHGYTYEGSTWGKIVQILIESKCMNPIIYFDELDKISDTPKGEEITGILTHLTDTTQNAQFHDKYFSEIDFDLSKCLFIFSYNDENKVNPILKDRMYRIQTKGYNSKQKTHISNNYLLPKIREQVKFAPQDIIIPDQTVGYIIDNFCQKEDGVRNLKRCLEIIYTKLNLFRLMRSNTNLFEEDITLKVQFPITITKDIVDKLIKKNSDFDPSLFHLYI